MMRAIGVVALLSIGVTNAHVRWNCPIPRNDNSAIKQGPCGTGNQNPGVLTDDFPRVELSPGPLTISFEETIRHQGSPYRIALSRESEDEYEDCILLNHIPHYDTSTSGLFYTLTIDIPDVQCDNCALQLIQVMVDKISVPQCNYNVDLSASFDRDLINAGNCFSNYHSCANVRINGTTPRNDYVCAEPADWPFNNLLTFNYSQGEAGAWTPPAQGSLNIGALQAQQPGVRGTVPARFNEFADGCSSADSVPAVPVVDNGGGGGGGGGGGVNPDTTSQATMTTTLVGGVTTLVGGVTTMLGGATAMPVFEQGSGVLQLYSTYATIIYSMSSFLNFLL